MPSQSGNARAGQAIKLHQISGRTTFRISLTGQRLTNQLSDSSGPVRTESYGYDALNRLTSVNYGDGETQSYAFDAMGNRTSKSVTTSGTTSESYTYNNADMLLSRGSNSYTNDSNGNTLTGGGRTNTWDGENRLTQCTYGGVTSTHTYGADGLRRRTVSGSNTTDFLLDGQNAIRSVLNGSIDKTYLVGPRGPEYERTGSGDAVWYLYDGLGSVLGTVNGSGTIVSSRKYDVYGAVRGSGGSTGTAHKFVGALGHPSDDDTGLVYMRARYYDPSLGRFINEDPARDGSNWYIYAGSNPVNNFDYSGLFIDTLISLLDGLKEEGDEAFMARQVQQYGSRKIAESVARATGKVMGALLEIELDSEACGCSDAGMYLKFVGKPNITLFIDFLNKHKHIGGPHIDLQLKGADVQRAFLEGLIEGLTS